MHSCCPGFAREITSPKSLLDIHQPQKDNSNK